MESDYLILSFLFAREIKSVRILALTDLTSMHFKLKHFKCTCTNCSQLSLKTGSFVSLYLRELENFYFKGSLLQNFKCI